MTKLFEGPFYNQLLTLPPMRSATYFKHGSSSMLFTDDDRLYRLTRQGCGHNFISQQSALGNPHVPRMIEDFGPVAPSDEGEGEFYWLAQIEWLQDLDTSQPQIQLLSSTLAELTEDDPQIYGDDLEGFAHRCLEVAKLKAELRGMLMTLATVSAFARDHAAMVDIKLDNIMLRSASGELVVADPICDHFFEINHTQRGELIQRGLT